MASPFLGKLAPILGFSELKSKLGWAQNPGHGRPFDLGRVFVIACDNMLAHGDLFMKLKIFGLFFLVGCNGTAPNPTPKQETAPILPAQTKFSKALPPCWGEPLWEAFTKHHWYVKVPYKSFQGEFIFALEGNWSDSPQIGIYIHRPSKKAYNPSFAIAFLNQDKLLEKEPGRFIIESGNSREAVLKDPGLTLEAKKKVLETAPEGIRDERERALLTTLATEVGTALWRCR